MEQMTPDEAGFRSWAAARRPQLRRTAYLICLDWHLADDLVQETLVKVYARWRRLAVRGEMDAYARRVLVTTHVDARRRPWRRETAAAELVDLRPDQASAAALRAAEGLDEQARLVATLRQLPPGQRAVLVLRYVEDLSVEQTAALLGCSTGNVKSQAARGLAHLRVLLAPPAQQGARS